MAPKRKPTKSPIPSRYKKKSKKINRVQLTRPLSYERKWYHVGFAPQQLNPGIPYCLNPFYLLNQGTAQDNRIGLNIQDVNLYVTWKYTSFGTTLLTAGKFGSTCFRSLCFANTAKWRQSTYNVPEVNTAGTGTVIPVSDVFLDSGVDRCTQSYVNKDYNKILYDTGCKVTMPASNQTVAAPNGINGGTITGKYTVKLGDLRYTSNSGSYLRDDNVYCWFVADALGISGTSSSDLMGEFSCNILVTFKDS